jgi:hypothetical protein
MEKSILTKLPADLPPVMTCWISLGAGHFPNGGGILLGATRITSTG